MARPLIVALLILIAAPLAAQPPGAAVRGIVRDASGALAGGAKATVTHRETNLIRAVETADDGQYVVSALPPGPYRLEVSRGGFKTYVEEFELFVSQDLRVDVALQVGAPSEQVLVVASSIALERDSTAVGTVVENTQVVNLPLDGRNFLELALLAPGTAPAAQGSASSVRGDFAFTAAGGREDANGFLLDGVDNVDPKLNTPAVRPPVDAIREFEVLTSSYEPEIGRYGAGQVNVVLKSGTNNLHGTGYGFFRTGAMDATQLLRAARRAGAGLQPQPVRRLHRRAHQPRPPVLLRRLRGHARHRRHHAGHQCADRRRAGRRLLAERAAQANQLLHRPAVSRRPDSVVLPEPDRAGDRGAVSAAQPQRAARQLRLVAEPRRPQRAVRRARRPAVGGWAGSVGALQLFGPHAARAVCRLRLLARARLRQHARSSRAESGGVGRERDHAAPAERGAVRLHARRQPGEPGRPGHQHQPAGRLAGALGEPARLGPELHHGHRLLAARAGIQQPAEGHHRRLPVRGHADVEPRARTWSRAGSTCEPCGRTRSATSRPAGSWRSPRLRTPATGWRIFCWACRPSPSAHRSTTRSAFAPRTSASSFRISGARPAR